MSTWEVSAARQVREVWEQGVGTKQPQMVCCSDPRRAVPEPVLRCASFNSGILRSGRCAAMKADLCGGCRARD